MFFKRIILILALASSVTACSSTRSYTATGTPNLTVTMEGDGGPLMAIRSAGLHLNSIKEGCVTEYEGTVSVSRDAPAEIAVPVGQPLYGEFYINDTGLLWEPARHQSLTFQFTPERDYRYILTYKTENRAYGLRLKQVSLKTGVSKDMDIKGWNSCN